MLRDLAPDDLIFMNDTCGVTEEFASAKAVILGQRLIRLEDQ